MSIKLKNTETGQVVPCIGLWTNPVYMPRKIYALDSMGMGHAAEDENMIEYIGYQNPTGQNEDGWKIFKPVKPWEIL